MKKVISLLLILAFCVAFTGCKKKNQEAKVREPEKPSGGFEVLENNSLFGWLKRGKAVVCEVKDEDGTVKVSTKNNKVRIDGMPYASMDGSAQDEDGTSLTTGDWMYMWAGNEGFKMNLKRMEEIAKELGGEEEDEQKTWEETVRDWDEDEGVEYDCKETKLNDSLFVPPSNVVFTDYTEFMEGIANMATGLQGSMDSPDEVDLDALEAEMEKLKEKYDVE